MKISSKDSSAKKLGELLRKDQDFTDVTLVCADGHKVSCHRAVLAASSSFLHRILFESPQQRTFLFLGVRVEVQEVEALLELIYLGSTNLEEARLSAFQALTRELQLDNEILFGDELREQVDCDEDMKKELTEAKYPGCEEGNLIEEVILPKKKVAKCPRCGVEVSLKSLSRHILRNHTEGDQYKVACKDCGKIFKDKSHLTNHAKRKQCRADPEKWPLLCGRGCGLRFRTLHTMERHQRNNCPVKLQCEDCPESFSQFRQLKKHRSLCFAERSDQVGFGEEGEEEVVKEEDDDDEEEEELVSNFMEEEEALAELQDQLRDLE